jgi:hypothetical protein
MKPFFWSEYEKKITPEVEKLVILSVTSFGF